jgi:hypothetical protein
VVLPEDIELEVWIDPGTQHAYAVLFVAIHDEKVYVLDEIWVKDKITEQVITMATQHPLWKRVKRGVIDIAGEQRHAMAAPALLWRSKDWAGLQLGEQKVGIKDGIVRLRSFFQLDSRFTPPQPKLLISPKCSGLIWELSDGWRYKLDKEKQVFSEEPYKIHDDACKALIYGLVDHFGLVTRSRRSSPRTRPLPPWEARRAYRSK